MFICRLVAAVVFVSALAAVPASAAPILFIDPVNTTVTAGDSVVLNIKVDTISDLFSFSFDLLFDQTILTFQSIVEGSFLQANGDPTFFIPGTVFPPGSGTLSGTGNVVLGPGVSGSGTLAIATFLASAAGTSAISFQDPIFVDSNGDPITFARGDIQGGSVTVDPGATVVPEPSTMILLGSGLVLAARRRLRRPSTPA